VKNQKMLPIFVTGFAQYCCNVDDPDMLISGQQACPNFSPGADVGLKWRNFYLSQHSQTRINTWTERPVTKIGNFVLHDR
jgi:hypothetical protein